jgi:CBS domain-containing protein
MRLGGETMAETIDEMMTTDLRTVRDGATIEEAARVMRDADIGDVIVLDEDGRVSGIVTDRDLVVRRSRSRGGPGWEHPEWSGCVDCTR